MNTEKLWLNFTNVNTSDRNPFIVKEAKDGYIFDENRIKYFDAISGIWNTSFGYSRNDIIDNIHAEMKKLSSTPLFGRAYPLLIEYTNRLIDVAPEYSKVFYGTGGTDSVETALKIAQNSFYISGLKTKTKIGHFKNSYHGVSLGCLNVMGEEPNREGYVLDNENYFKLDWPKTNEEYKTIFDEINFHNPDEVAAIIVEPIVGSGGIFVFPKEFLKELREYTSKNNIILIFDEVVTGFGRTGSLFYYQQIGVVPDILVLAKGITAGYAPLGATLVSDKLVDVYRNNKTKFMHGYTNAGSVVSIAAAMKVLDIFENENIIENVSKKSGKLFFHLNKLKNKYENLVEKIKGKGLMIGIELKKVSTDGNELEIFYEILAKHNILSRSAYENTVVLMPPLNVNDEFINSLISELDLVFEEYSKKV